MKTYRSSEIWTQLPYLNAFEEQKKERRKSWLGSWEKPRSQQAEGRVILGMASAFSVDGEDCSHSPYDIDIQDLHRQRAVNINGITRRGPINISCRSQTERSQSLQVSSVRRSIDPEHSIAKPSSPGFFETFSEDGTRLLAVDYMGLLNTHEKERLRWELDVPTPRWQRVYGLHKDRLIWHIRKKDRKRGQANVVCLDITGKIKWMKTEPLNIVKIYTNERYVGFLVEPGVNPFYWFYLVDAESGEALKVLDLSQFNSPAEDMAPDIVLTDEYLICSSTVNDFIRSHATISLFKIADFLQDNEDTVDPQELIVPDHVTGSVHQLRASADGRYIAALIIDATFSTKAVSLLVWDTTRLHNPQPKIKRIVQPPLTSRRGTFTTGLWCVEEIDGVIEISYTEVHL